MSTDLSGDTFHLVVSDKDDSKLGSGGSSRIASRTIFFYAERTAEGVIFLQALNGNHCPSGKKRNLTLEELIESYRPEPLFYYNKVKPVIDGVESNLEKGEKNLEADRPDVAEKCFRRALEVDEANVRGLFGLGMAYLSAGKTEDASEILDRIMNLEMAFSTEHTHLFNRFGIRMRKSGMLREALGYYGKAITLNGADENLHFNISRIHLELNDLEAALDSVTKALLLNEDFAEGKKMLEHLVRLKPEMACRITEDPSPEVSARTEGLDLDGLPWESA